MYSLWISLAARQETKEDRVVDVVWTPERQQDTQAEYDSPCHSLVVIMTSTYSAQQWCTAMERKVSGPA